MRADSATGVFEGRALASLLKRLLPAGGHLVLGKGVGPARTTTHDTRLEDAGRQRREGLTMGAMTVRELIEALEALNAPDAFVLARDPHCCGQGGSSECAWWSPVIRPVRVKEPSGVSEDGPEAQGTFFGIEAPNDMLAYAEDGHWVNMDGEVRDPFIEPWDWRREDVS